MKYLSDFTGLFDALDDLKTQKELVISTNFFEDPEDFYNKMIVVLKEFNCDFSKERKSIDTFIIRMK